MQEEEASVELIEQALTEVDRTVRTAQQQAGMDVAVEEQAARVQVEQAQPEVRVQEQAADVTVQQQAPDIAIEQARPDVTVRQEQPQVQVEQTPPQVEIVQPEVIVTLGKSAAQFLLNSDAAMGARAECVMLNKGPYVADGITVLDNVLTRMERHQVKKSPQLRALAAWPGTV